MKTETLGYQRMHILPQVRRFAGLWPGRLRPVRVIAGEVRDLLRDGLCQIMVGDCRRRGGFSGGNGRKGQNDGVSSVASGGPLGS
jgi:hypothetical protein